MMIVTRVTREPYNESGCVKLGTYNFEIVKNYTYLGTALTNKSELALETEERITNANRAYCAPFPVLKSQSLPRAEKVKIFKTLIRQVATYRAESFYTE
jgi:acyl-coenzyme A synthetase/AMP-(fatty) acid ligase